MGWLISYLGKLLDDKKNIAILQEQVKDLRSDVEELKVENRDLRKKVFTHN
jgi:hypothetical protein